MKTFKEKVYDVVAKIPRGKMMTYKAVAVKAGSPGASRAVGTFMKHNPDKAHIPCHRVVRSDGVIGDYAFGGRSVKIALLRKEGAIK